MSRLSRFLAISTGLALVMGLSGCDMLGIESGTAVAARKEAEGKAIGSACRQAMRAIEDCYVMNPKASKASIYAGWREMDEYMRENKIEGVTPVIPRKPKAPADGDTPPADEAEAKDKPEKPAKSGH